MSYAVLSEVWPDFIHSNKFKKYVNTLPKNIVNNLIESAETRGGNKYRKNTIKTQVEPIMYEKSRDHPVDHKEKKIEKFSNLQLGKYQTECSSILQHLSQCSKCRKFVQSKFAPQKPETEEDEENDEYLDLAIYIVTGIFVLFILDMLMKFGKRRR